MQSTGQQQDTFATTVGYERTRKTAGEKVGDSLRGLLIGPVIIFFGCMLLWYNEEWAIKTHRSLNEALEAAVEVYDVKAAMHEHRGQLVHVTGTLTTPDVLTDPLFDLSRSNTIALHRNVEIYQWVESIQKKKVKRGEQTEIQEVVSYNQKWVKAPVDSGNFRHPLNHENQGELPMQSESFHSPAVKLEDNLLLSSALVNQVQQSKSIGSREVKKLPSGSVRSGNSIYFPRNSNNHAAIDSPNEAVIEEKTVRVDGEVRKMYEIKATGESFSTKEKALAALASTAIEEKTVKFDGEDKTMFVVKDTGDSYSTREKALEAAMAIAPNQQQRDIVNRDVKINEPQIGDVRVTFSEIPCAMVSILAKLSGTTLTKWSSKQGSGYDVASLTYGAVSVQEMIASAQDANTMKTWGLRAAGWALNWIGYGMITSIVSTTADISLNWIPVLGGMATSLINLGVSIANIILANCTTMLVASIAWVFYRPVLGITLLVGSLGLFFGASSIGRKKKDADPKSE